MDYQELHSWDMTPEEARAAQTALRSRVILADDFGDIQTIAGLDLSYSEEKGEGYAVVVVLSFPEFEVLETRYATATPPMPYIPGLLSFRESPIALQALQQLQAVPDLLFTDGAGLAHPRGFGIACHLGVLLNIPSVGVAKSFLYGKYDKNRTLEPGMSTPLHGKNEQEIIGAVVQTKLRTNPLYVSPGHKVSVDSATRLVLECLRGYRLPEPTRQAHNLITAYRKTNADKDAPE